MLRALTTVFRRRARDLSAQLALPLDAPPRDAGELLDRLRAHGLTRTTQCRLTRNRNVMVSFRGRELRVHEGYLMAPADVHQAIVAFVEGRTRAERRAARRRIMSYVIPPAEGPRQPVRRERMRPEDAPLATRLADWHARLNREHFAGTLTTVPVRISRRMKSRLGHYSAARGGERAEIAISWRHVKRHGWDEVVHTLLHEMVHQWQDETGRPIDHGSAFRAKARELGIHAAAKRAVTHAATQTATQAVTQR